MALNQQLASVKGEVHAARDEELAGASGADGLRWIVLDAFGGRRDAVRVSPEGLELTASGFRG